MTRCAFALRLVLTVAAAALLARCDAQAAGPGGTQQPALDLANAFRKSDELGVTRCSLPGTLEGARDVVLHIWLRVAPPRAVAQPCRPPDVPPGCGTTAKARGFAMLQDVKRSVPLRGYVLQMIQSSALDSFRYPIFLRSSATGSVYNITRKMPGLKQHVQSFPDLPASKVVNNVIDLFGSFQMHPNDTNALDLELRVGGFRWHCNVVISPPVLAAEVRRQLAPGGSPAAAAPGPVPVLRPSQHLAWRHVDRASMTNETEVWVLLTNYFAVDMQHYARMLWLHVLWHAKLGIHRYLLHVSERLSELLAHPGIQELVRREILVVVLFDDLPRHEREPLNPGRNDAYSLQIVQYNHAALSLWGSDSLMLVVDLDEYLMTPTPKTAVQVFHECSNRGPNVADLQLSRVTAACRPGIPVEACDPAGAMMTPTTGWGGAPLPDIEAGRIPHPLDATTFVNRITHAPNDVKAMVDPNTVQDLHVHQAFLTLRGDSGFKVQAPDSCARLMHVTNLLSLRQAFGPADVVAPTPAARAWWWPVRMTNVTAGVAGQSGPQQQAMQRADNRTAAVVAAPVVVTPATPSRVGVAPSAQPAGVQGQTRSTGQGAEAEGPPTPLLIHKTDSKAPFVQPDPGFAGVRWRDPWARKPAPRARPQQAVQQPRQQATQERVGGAQPLQDVQRSMRRLGDAQRPTATVIPEGMQDVFREAGLVRDADPDTQV